VKIDWLIDIISSQKENSYQRSHLPRNQVFLKVWVSDRDRIFPETGFFSRILLPNQVSESDRIFSETEFFRDHGVIICIKLYILSV